MLDRQLRLCDTALVEERLDLDGGGVRRGGRDRVQQALRRVGRLASRKTLHESERNNISATYDGAGVRRRQSEVEPKKNNQTTYAVADELEARGRQELDEFRVELLVGVPRTAGHLCRRLEVEEHVDFSGRVLETQEVVSVPPFKMKKKNRVWCCRTCTLPLMHFTSFFCVSDLRHRSMIVW